MKPKQAFAAFRQWRKRADLSNKAERQAHLCGLYVDCLEINLPNPPKQIRERALDELHNLEAMLAFPTI